MTSTKDDLLDCVGCGFAFKTERGHQGNRYFAGIEDWVLIHECSYCQAVTPISEGRLNMPLASKRKKDWRYR